MRIHRRVLSNTRSLIALVAVTGVTSTHSCKQRMTGLPVKISKPADVPIIEPNPVDPIQVEELKKDFAAALRKVQQEPTNVREARPIAEQLKSKRRPRTYIVQFRPEMVALKNGENPDTPILAAGGLIKRRHKLISAATVEFPRATDNTHMIAIAKFLEDNSHIASIEPDSLVKAVATPNDAKFSELWGLYNTGNSRVDIRATAAWEKTTGSRNIVVGIIDSGVDYNHPDLAANIWNNPGETGIDNQGRDKRSNGVDDDGNGYVDDFRGWDFASNDNDPMDTNNHGTHVAGTIGAVGNNGSGVTGVNWQISLAPLRFLDDNGEGYVSDAMTALEYATRMGFFATNNSWAGGSYSSTMVEAIKRARNAGQLFIAAAGNDSANNDKTAAYPANYSVENVISVAAVDRNGNLGWFSNYGATKVHVAAPGLEILSTIPNGSYARYQGTSMAAPHVTGAAALMKAAEPSLTYATIKQRLIASSTILPSLAQKCASGGIINVDAAIGFVPDTIPPNPPTNLAVTSRGLQTATLSWTPATDGNADGTIKSYQIKQSSSPITTVEQWNAAIDLSGTVFTTTAEKISATVTLPAASQVHLAVRALDQAGNLSNISASIPLTLLPLSMKASYSGDSLTGFPQTPWVTETDAARGGVFSDGSGTYPANADRWLRLPSIPLRGQDKLVLRFWNRYELESGYDNGFVTLESDAGGSPTIIKTVTGASNGWELIEIDITPQMIELQKTATASTLSIGFRLVSDRSIQYDGWRVDDITLLQLTPAFNAATIPANPSADRSFNVKLSQSGDQELTKIKNYRYSFSQSTFVDCRTSDQATDRPLSEPMTGDIPEFGLARLCVHASLNDYNETITRVYAWEREAAEAPVARINGLPVGESNLRNLTATVSGSNVAFYSYYLGTSDASSCQNGSFSEWSAISQPLSFSITSEQKNIVCVKGKSIDGVIQSEPSTFEWSSDFTPPSIELSGQPPISTHKSPGTITVSSSDAISYIFATGTTPTDCVNYSTSSPIATPISLTVVPNGDGPRVLCVKGTDRAGNEQSTAQTLTWVQDSVAKAVTFTGLPAALSNAGTLDVTVSAPEAGIYRYKLSAGSTCDTLMLRQAPARELSQNIVDTLPAADGPYTLCAALTDAAGNNQDPVTSYNWIKDTQPPKSVLSNLPPLRSGQESINVKVSGDGVVSYLYMIAVNAGTCPETGYSNSQPVASTIVASISGEGQRTLCVKGIDAVGNTQIKPTTYTWTKISPPIIRPVLSRVPFSPNSRTRPNIAVSSPAGQKLVSYRYGYASGLPANCARVQKWSESISISRPLNDYMGDFEGYKTLCVLAKDADGFEQLTPSAATWLRLNGTSVSPSPDDYATASLTSKSSGSVTMTINRIGTTRSKLRADTLRTRFCRVDLATGIIVPNSCVSGSVRFTQDQRSTTVSQSGLPAGEYIFVAFMTIGSQYRVEPVRFNL